VAFAVATPALPRETVARGRGGTTSRSHGSGWGSAQRAPGRPASILTIDVGGTKVKILGDRANGAPQGYLWKRLHPARLVEKVRALAHDWEFEAVSIGYPAWSALMGRAPSRESRAGMGRL